MARREDLNQWSVESRASSIISNEPHSIATPEELLAQLWNIGMSDPDCERHGPGNNTKGH
jgi:hypothetical protein